ncbi:hypothetical protein SFRURICE_001198, partial [Spodoptera frugiperda]
TEQKFGVVQKNTCSACIKTKSNPLKVIRETTHKHGPEKLETTDIKEQMEKCINAVRHDVSIPVPKVFNEHMQILAEKGVQNLPKFENVSKNLYQKRNSSIGAKKLCFRRSLSRCNFHFNQCLWRAAKKFDLHKTQSGKTHVKLCAALSHIPPQFVDDGWLYIMAESPSIDNYRKFNDYFVSTWLEDNVNSNIWCTYNEYHKTNNIVESWNNRIRKYIKVKPNIGQLLQGLHNDIKYYLNQISKPNGIQISKRKPKTLERNWIIQTTINELLTGQISVGHCLEKISLIYFSLPDILCKTTTTTTIDAYLSSQ